MTLEEIQKLRGQIALHLGSGDADILTDDENKFLARLYFRPDDEVEEEASEIKTLLAKAIKLV